MKFKQTSISCCAVALMACALLLVGCGGEGGTESSADPATTGGSLPDGIILAAAPEGVQPIDKLKADAEEGDEVVVRVIVGGRMEPIVAGRASAIVIDAKVGNACLAEDDHCTTPWDYCCTPKEEMDPNTATIQVVDGDGRVIAADLTQHFESLSTLVVKGTVGPRPDAQVLTINATGIYVEAATP